MSTHAKELENVCSVNETKTPEPEPQFTTPKMKAKNVFTAACD